MPPPERDKYLSISVKTNPVYNLRQAAEASHKPYGVDGPFPVQRTTVIIGVSERINPFPTKYIAKFQFDNKLS